MVTDEVIAAERIAALWPRPLSDDDKYMRGVLGVVAGSEAYPGAAVLCVSGAARAGAGMVRYVGPRRAQELVLAARPETVVHADADAVDRLPRAHAWVVGSGVSDSPSQDAVIGGVWAAGLPCVVDAGALEDCARARHSGARNAPAEKVLLTPHEGELVRALTGIGHDVTPEDVQGDRAGHARLLAETTRSTVLLKGSQTLVVAPGGQMRTLPVASPWLATAGSGDVLAGIAGALLAAGLDAVDAGVCAAWMHGRAAALASGDSLLSPDGRGGPITASDIAGALTAAVTSLPR